MLSWQNKMLFWVKMSWHLDELFNYLPSTLLLISYACFVSWRVNSWCTVMPKILYAELTRDTHIKFIPLLCNQINIINKKNIFYVKKFLFSRYTYNLFYFILLLLLDKKIYFRVLCPNVVMWEYVFIFVCIVFVKVKTFLFFN